MVATANHMGGSPEEEFGRLLRELRTRAGGDSSYRLLALKTSIPASTLHNVFSGMGLTSWENTEKLLGALDAHPRQAEQIRRAWEETRRARELLRARAARPPGLDERAAPSTPVVIHGDGSTVYVNNVADSGGGSPAHEPPPLIPDMDGHALKPDPLKATTFDELIESMQEFRAWAGRPSTRDLAIRSGGEFSHSTISNILFKEPGRKPPLKLGYVRGFIRACGGDEEDLKRWVTAWRRIDQGKAAPHARADNVIAMKPPAEPAS